MLFRTQIVSQKKYLTASAADGGSDQAPRFETLFMLNSIEHEILNAHKHMYQERRHFLGSDKPSMLFFPLINVNINSL